MSSSSAARLLAAGVLAAAALAPLFAAMSPPAALLLAAAAAGVWRAAGRRRRADGKRRRLDILALPGVAVGWTAMTGHLYHVPSFYRFGFLPPLPFATAACLFALSLAVICLNAEGGAAELFFKESVAGSAARRLASALVILPVALWARLEAQRAGWIDVTTGTAFLTVGMTALALALIWWCARSLDRFETAQHRVRQDTTNLIVHDLRSPLSTQMLYLDVIGQMTPQPEAARLIADARQASEFMLMLVDDLLDLGSGAVKAEFAPVPLEPLAARLEALHRPQLQSKRLAWKTDFGGLTKVDADEKLLFRALANLIGNAVKYQDPGGEVVLAFSALDGTYRAEVRDRGPGVPDDEKPLIFTRYYRLKNEATQASAGSGIGLSFCRLAALAHGGAIGVENREGGGSCFVMDWSRERRARSDGSAGALERS